MTARDYTTALRCPICKEAMDATDMSIRYCSCEYRLCRLCWNDIMDKACKEGKQGLCPNCKNPYDDSNKLTFLNAAHQASVLNQQHQMSSSGSNNVMAGPVGNNNASVMSKKENVEEKKNKKSGKKKGNGINLTVKTRKQLQDLRILQRNLVYTVGLSMDICKEEVLSGNNYFAKFGKIKKISVNRNSTYSTGQSKNGPTGAAYVTYISADDAARCVDTIDGAIWDGRYIRACFGTTKYCQAFLKGAQCNNPDCLYMHHIVHEGTCTKEEMSSGFANGKPDFYDLINFDRQKGPVPGSLANKPPKGPILSSTSTSNANISSMPFKKHLKDDSKKDPSSNNNVPNNLTNLQQSSCNSTKDLQEWPHLTSRTSPDPNMTSSDYETPEHLIVPLMSRRSADPMWPGHQHHHHHHHQQHNQHHHQLINNRTSRLMATSSVPPPVTQNVSSSPKTPENQQQQPYTVLNNNNNSPIRSKILTHLTNPNLPPHPSKSTTNTLTNSDLLRSKKSADDSIISGNSQYSEEGKVSNPEVTSSMLAVVPGGGHNNNNGMSSLNQV